MIWQWILPLMLLPLPLAAELLLPNHDLETAEVLPKGVISPRFLTITGSLSSVYDNEGKSMAAAASLSQQVTWRDVLAGQGNDAERAALRALLMSDEPIGEETLAGEIVAEANSRTTAHVPVLLVGMTDRLMLGIAVPVLHVDAQADADFSGADAAQQVIDRACRASSPVKCGESATRLNRAVQQTLSDYGYQPLSPRSLTALGDIRLIAKYSLLPTGSSQLSIRPTIYLPTGQAPSPDDVLGMKTGEGRIAMALSLIFDQRELVSLLPGLKLNLYSGYLAYLPDRPEMRIPSSSSFLSADKEKVQRGLTSATHAGMSLSHAFGSTGIVVGAGYHAQYQWETSISGTQFTEDRYARLRERHPSRFLHNGTLLAGVSTIEWYRAQWFPLPMVVNFTYNRPLGGRNAWNNDLLAGEFIVYL